MKSNSKNSIKRSISPLVPKATIQSQKVMETSERKKKSNSNYIYAKVAKEFQTYGKHQKNRNLKNQFRQSIKGDDQKNKYRILTQPVDDKILHLAKSNVFNTSYQKVSRSNKKIEHQHAQPLIKFQLRSSTHSRQKVKLTQCPNCQRFQIEIAKYVKQVEYVKEQLNKIIMTKAQWKSGELSFKDVIDKFKINLHSGTAKKKEQKLTEQILNDVKKHFADFMKDVDSLSSIDYLKMLQMDIFHYQPSIADQLDHQYTELKELLGQLKYNIEGKVLQYQIEDYHQQDRNANIIRNLKNRLGHCLRQNIELRAKKQILQKANEISGQSQEYLKAIIQQVLLNYSTKTKKKDSEIAI